MDTARNKFFVEYENLYSTYNSLVNNEQTTILVTKALNSNINAHYNKYQKAVYTRLEASSDYYEANLNYLAKLFPNSENPEFLNSLQSYINQIAPFEVDKDILPDLEQYVLLAQEKLGNDGTDGEEMSGLYKEIYDYYNKYITNDNVAYTKEIISMITDYNLLANYTNIIVTSSIKVNGLEKLGATDVQKYTVFANSNLYEMQEKLAKTKYLFDTNQYEYDFASVFSINQPSNTEINAFDYSYFALRLCTLFIIVYIVVLAAGTIAGEQSMGTMKLLAIRPYNRRKLLTGKILSILTIGAILLSVCSVATLVIGGINYGFDSALILCVFNASKVYTSGALSVYLVALLSMFIEIAFYAILSTFISTVFKSNIGAVTVSILLFFVSLVLNIIAINVPILRFLPFTNINLFKYFGASFVATNNAQSVLQGILTPTVFVGATFTLSIIMLTVTIVALLVATYTKFSKQDIKWWLYL